jgi:ABC-type multidrug transport system fused ATPase/permease subunit
MVAKLYNPQQGKILAGKVDIAEIAPEDWRRRLGYVSQDNFMFHATVAENIRVGRSGASMDDVRKAAAMADAAEFIERLPDGYDTVIGHGGIALSGGQRQRISIARALIRRPEIIIFDEATSALDAESEYRILEHLKKLAANCIVLVTTHRLKTLRIADKIFWFNSGRLQESGSFDELMNAGGEFASVIQSGEVV